MASWRSSAGPILVVGSCLLALAAWLLKIQPDRLHWRDPGSERIAWACALVLAYLIACAFSMARARRRKSAPLLAATRVDTIDAHAEDLSEPPLLIAYASQTGFAQQVAEQTAQSLGDAGLRVELQELNALDADILARYRRALFVVSTTGEGDAPDAAASFVGEVMGAATDLRALQYGLLALGDSEYDEFCGFGRNLDQWLLANGAQAQFDRIEVDCEDAGALRHWQYHVGLFTGCADLPDWERPRYARWQLRARRQLNPGSVGNACFHLELVPLDAAALRWKAGDVVEIGPQNPIAEVQQFLHALGLDAEQSVIVRGQSESLLAVLARRRLPAANTVSGLPAQALVDALKPLSHRAYSIASIPTDGAIHLLVRQMIGADGRMGPGSGWLTEHAPIGAEIALRVRENPGFHVPVADAPLILIGNGTGLAGLRAVLKQRITQGRRRNWLLFGERNVAHDFLHGEELTRWQAEGWIEHLDLAFSRDQSERIYVQQRLAGQADRLREWVAEGATLMVCGSLAGMAPEVDATLRRALGEAMLVRLGAEGRYRRDVY